jgi:hypothetical protein
LMRVWIATSVRDSAWFLIQWPELSSSLSLTPCSSSYSWERTTRYSSSLTITTRPRQRMIPTTTRWALGFLTANHRCKIL